MIKVVEVLNNMVMGGAESLVKDYATFMNHDEFEMTVIVADKERGTPNEKALDKLGVKTIYIGNSLNHEVSKWNIIGKYDRLIKRNRLFYQALNQEKPDVIHAHQHITKQVYNYVKKNPGVTRLFYTVHSLPTRVFRKKSEKEVMKKLIKRHGLRLIALQNQAANELKEMFETQNVLVIPNGIDYMRFRDARGERGVYGIPKDAVVIGNVGRMISSKNQSFLIEIFEKYREIEPRAFLLLVGNGERKQELLEIIKQKGLDHCSLVLSDRGDIPELMKTMDCFVFPSLYEGFGLVVIEAQACGLKCVISDKIPEETYISDRISVVSVEESADTWVKAIEKDEFRVMRKYPMEIYDIRNIVNMIEDLYRGLR